MTIYTTRTQRVIVAARKGLRVFIEWLCGDRSLTGHYKDH